jgi:hypothetical protein
MTLAALLIALGTGSVFVLATAWASWCEWWADGDEAGERGAW